jgi:hypothetical protein
MADSTAANTGIWASTIASASKKDFRDIKTNDDLFQRMALPACFKQCSRTDIDIVFMDEMECTYKCMITYKDTLRHFRRLDHQ